MIMTEKERKLEEMRRGLERIRESAEKQEGVLYVPEPAKAANSNHKKFGYPTEIYSIME